MGRTCQLCSAQPFYGNAFGDVPVFCQKHRLDKSVNVYVRMCIICVTQSARWGVGGQPFTHCGKCKTDDMLSRPRKLCEGCHKHEPSWSLPGKVRSHCTACKSEEMVSKQKMCDICHSHQASFGNRGGLATRCAVCKEDCMIYLKRICKGCGVTAPVFGFMGSGKATHCKGCKEDGMVDVLNKRCVSCVDRFACFGSPSSKRASHCSQCSTVGMVNVHESKCNFPGCIVRCPRRRGYTICANHDTERKRKTRVREIKVANAIRESDLPPWTSWNKEIKGTDKDVCGKFRPDFTWEMPRHVVVLEVDEHQHPVALYSCENGRMLDIWNSYGGMPVTMIRWNPDAFKLDGTTRRVSWEKRLQLLFKTLKKEMSEPGRHLFAVHRLFYDNPGSDFVSSTVVAGMDTGNFVESPL